MEFKKIVEWLLANGYLASIGGKPVITAKFERDVGYVTPVGETPIEVIPVVPGNVDRPMSQITDPKILWNWFIHDSGIPWRVKTQDGGSYTVRQYSLSMAKKLMRIVKDPSVDYNTLIASTKHYYETTSYKLLLSNYIDKDVWRDAYNEYAKNKGKSTSNVGDGSNRWES